MVLIYGIATNLHACGHFVVLDTLKIKKRYQKSQVCGTRKVI